MNAETARQRYDSAICWTTGRDIPEGACFAFAEWFMHSDVPLEGAFDVWCRACPSCGEPLSQPAGSLSFYWRCNNPACSVIAHYVRAPEVTS